MPYEGCNLQNQATRLWFGAEFFSTHHLMHLVKILIFFPHLDLEESDGHWLRRCVDTTLGMMGSDRNEGRMGK